MRRIIALLISFSLLTGTVSFAEPEASQAVITIDGIRVAFFSDDGTWLPPLESGGLVWVPAVSLGESLGLSVTADPETLAVTVDGIRVAFFDEENRYLSPFTQDGTVFVPLTAFAASAGLDCSADGNTYALNRTSQSTPEATAAGPVELFGLVPLTTGNYSNYFMISEDYSAPQNYPNPYYITFTLTVTATTGYELVNAELTVDQYGLVRIPATGTATVSRQTEPIYGAAKSRDYIDAVARAVGSATLDVLSPPTVSAAGGFIRMSKAEADRINEEMYQRAMRSVENADTIPFIQSASSVLVRLQQAGYPVTEDDLEAARTKRRAIEAAEEEAEIKRQEEKLAETYSQAETALKEEKYDEAIALFTDLKDKGYRDSTDRLEEALRLQEEALFLQDKASLEKARTCIESGSLKQAVELLSPLAKKNFENSRELLETINSEMEIQYQAALELENARDFSGAADAFSVLADLGYSDSRKHMNANTKALNLLEKQRVSYALGIAAEKSKNWTEALDRFFACRDYSNANAHIISCLLNADDLLILPPKDDGFYFTYKDTNGYANMKTGELKILKIAGFPLNNKQVSVLTKGLYLFTKTGTGVGLMNAAGETILESRWKHVNVWARIISASDGNKDSVGVPFQLINHDGTSFFNGDFYYVDSELLGYYALAGDPEGSPRVFICSGQAVASPDGREPVLSNDGEIYWIGTRNGQETLYAPDGSELFTADGIFHNHKSLTKDEPCHMHNGVVAFRKGDKWGLWDTVNNRQLVKPSFDQVFCFTESGVARFVQKGKYGMISSSGKILTPAKYEKMYTIANGMAQVSKPGVINVEKEKQEVTFYGFVNDSGREIIPMKYLGAGAFYTEAGVTWVAINHGTIKVGAQTFIRYWYYVIDKNGKKVMSLEKDYSELYKCRIWSPAVYCLPESDPQPAHKTELWLYLNGEMKGSPVDEVKQLNDRLLLTSRKSSEGLYSYEVYDSATTRSLLMLEKQPKLAFAAFSTEDGVLIVSSYNDEEWHYWLFNSENEKWTADIPESLPEPTEADIERIAGKAGL